MEQKTERRDVNQSVQRDMHALNYCIIGDVLYRAVIRRVSISTLQFSYRATLMISPSHEPGYMINNGQWPKTGAPDVVLAKNACT